MQSFYTLLRRIVACVAVLAASTGLAMAQDLNANLPVDPNVVKGTLPNGLTYYIRNNHKPEKKVELRLVVKAGSILENPDQLGLAHFMEHMNFNGTKNFQKNDLVSYLQSIGVQFGADLNANTGFDQTIYILPIPTDKPGNLEKGFQIIEDWAHNANLTDKDIDEERGVVLEESRLGKGANDRMLKKYFPKLAGGSLYADRLPIGTDEILHTFKYDKIRSFYHDWYRPDIQAVIVVGDIDPETAKKMITEHFGSIKNPANERTREYVDVKPRAVSEAMVVTDKEATNSILQILFSYTKKHPETTLGDYKYDLERELVQQMLNRRLNDLAQGSNPPFPFAQVGMDDLIHGYECLAAFAAFSGSPEKAVNALTGEMLRAKQYGFSESELDLAKKEMMSGIEKIHNEKNTTESGSYVREYISNFTSGEAMPGIDNEFSYYNSMLPSIHADDVNGIIKDLMSNPNTFTLVMAPDKPEVKLPTDKELLDMTDKGFHQQIAKEEEAVVATSLMTTLPNPGKVTSQKNEDGLDATVYTLSNGIKVTIKPTTFKSDEILMTGIKKGGTNNYGLADRSNVHFATDVMDAMGYGTFTPNDIEKVLAGKKIEASMAMDEISDQVKCSSTINDFEAMLQLTYLQIMSPRKDKALFDAFKEKSKSQLQFITANPQASFIDTMVYTMYGGNPLRRMVFPKPEDFDKLNMDRTVEIYTNEFGSADGYQFFIVGNVNKETAIPLIERYLGSIPVANKTSAYKDNGVHPVPGVHEMKFHKGKDKKSLVLGIYYGEAPYSEDFALKARAVAECLNIKVIEVIREKMAAIYSGGVSAQVSKEPYERFSVQMQLPCGPENVDKVIAAANDLIKDLKENGPDAKDLDKVKSQWREKYTTDTKTNKYWEDKMQGVLFWGRDKDRALHYESLIDKLTPAEIQETAKKLFSGKNEMTAILYPES